MRQQKIFLYYIVVFATTIYPLYDSPPNSKTNSGPISIIPHVQKVNEHQPT